MTSTALAIRARRRTNGFPERNTNRNPTHPFCGLPVKIALRLGRALLRPYVGPMSETETRPKGRYRQRLDRQFERLQKQVPLAARFLAWVRKPSVMLVRIPLAFLLILGGIFSFLPILGLWMLPLGLLILALDVPLLERPVGSIIVRLQHWLASRRRKKSERKSQAE